MNLTLNSPASWSSAFQLPFSRKPNTVLTKLLKHKHFQECLQKTISLPKSDRLIFQQVLAGLKDFLRESGEGGSELGQQEVGIEVSERQERVYYDISRCFIKCNTLKVCLMEERPPVKATPAVVAALLRAYVSTANLNYMVCSSCNIFLKHRAWSKEVSFQFNFTSVGFLFDAFRKRGMHRVDVIEYANYLPYFFYSEQKIKERMGFSLKIRSFAVNLLSIVLQRDLNFTKNLGNSQLYSQDKIQQVLGQVHIYFGEFLDNQKNQAAIKASSAILGVDLLKFFTAVILKSRSSDFLQFNSWGKVIKYFNVGFLSPYLNILQLQPLLDIKTTCIQKKSYLWGWIRKMWNEQHKFIRQKFIMNGVVKDVEQNDLILYLLYKCRLINESHFVSPNEAYHPQFLKLVISLYSQIIESSFYLQSSQSNADDHSKRINSRNERLLAATRKVNECLLELSRQNKKEKHQEIGYEKGLKQLLFVAKDSIDIKSVYDKCWHFRV